MSSFCLQVINFIKLHELKDLPGKLTAMVHAPYLTMSEPLLKSNFLQADELQAAMTEYPTTTNGSGETMPYEFSGSKWGTSFSQTLYIRSYLLFPFVSLFGQRLIQPNMTLQLHYLTTLSS